jgi:hypothetical protein
MRNAPHEGKDGDPLAQTPASQPTTAEERDRDGGRTAKGKGERTNSSR